MRSIRNGRWNGRGRNSSRLAPTELSNYTHTRILWAFLLGTVWRHFSSVPSRSSATNIYFFSFFLLVCVGCCFFSFFLSPLASSFFQYKVAPTNNRLILQSSRKGSRFTFDLFHNTRKPCVWIGESTERFLP